MENKISALENFKKAFNNLVKEFENEESLNDLKSISLFPFEKSLDEYDVNHWVDMTVNELRDKEQQMWLEAKEEASFSFNGVNIIDPYLDESGRFEVNPAEYYGLANKTDSLVSIRYVKEINCLMMSKERVDGEKEIIGWKFYNPTTEAFRTKEEKEKFMKILEEDAKKLMQQKNTKEAVLDLKAFNEEAVSLQHESSFVNKCRQNNSELER